MVDINFHKQVEKEQGAVRGGGIASNGVFLSVVILIFTALIYGGTETYKKTIESNIESIEESIVAEKNSLDKDAINDVADFQKRIEKTSSNIANKNITNNKLASLEKNLVKSVYLKEYSHEGIDGTIKIEAVAANYESIAQQILNFKKASDSNNIKIEKISRDEEGRIVFSLSLNVSDKS